MVNICCNHCKQIIDEDDVEAVEIGKIFERSLYNGGDFKEASNNVVHYCGKCKIEYYCEWV